MTAAGPERTAAPLLGRLEALTFVGVVGVLALTSGVASLATPATRTVTRPVEYTQSGTFSYSASAAKSSPYGDQGLVTGQPILTQDVGPVTVAFDYQLKASDAQAVRGTASLVAIAQAPSGFSRTFVLAPERAFSGDHVTATGTLPVAAITSFLKASSAGGYSPAAATITITPTVDVSSALAGLPLKTSFSPSLPLAVNGGTYTVSGGSSSQDGGSSTDTLKPSKSGTVEHKISEPATVSLLVAHPSRTVALRGGFAVAALCLLLGAWIALPLLRGGEGGREADRIRALYGSHLVPVRALGLPEGPLAEVASMASLAEIAKRYESMIMHLADDAGDAYFVWDNGMTYRYATSENAPTARRSATAPENDKPVKRRVVGAHAGGGEARPGRTGLRQVSRSQPDVDAIG